MEGISYLYHKILMRFFMSKYISYCKFNLSQKIGKEACILFVINEIKKKTGKEVCILFVINRKTKRQFLTKIMTAAPN